MAFAQDNQEGWLNPPSEFRGAPFWSWNSDLTPERLCREIENMHKAGMGGFFMHSRYGLKTPYLSDRWFECIGACVEKARSLGMKANLYDEDRWPSGAAGGDVTRDHPEFRRRCIRPVLEGDLPANATEIARFKIDFAAPDVMKSYALAGPNDQGPGIVRIAVTIEGNSPWFNDASYIDPLNADAVAAFIRITHEAYAQRHGKDFGSVVPSIFTDEPNYLLWDANRNSGPWTDKFLAIFAERRGYDLRPHLPELFWPTEGKPFSTVLHDYHQTATELFVENFTRQIGQWCARHNIAFTGHMLCEENLISQTDRVGACMPHYEHMQWPGIDILRDQCDELSTAKQTASVADQMGHQRVLSELYGVTGWDWPLEGHKYVGDWQFAVGVNFRCQHLTHYSLAGGAKRDYPASFYAHSPWWKLNSIEEDYFGRLSLMLTRGKPIRDVLVLHPVESAWGLAYRKPDCLTELKNLNEQFKTAIYALSRGHYDWDFGDESLLAKHAKVAGASLEVGQMTYTTVVVPPTWTLRRSTAELLARFQAAGGKVLFVGQTPTAQGLDTVLARAARCEAVEGIIPALEKLLGRRVSITDAGQEASYAWYMMRQVEGGKLLFIQSHDRQAGHTVRVSVEGSAPAVLWDLRSGKQYELPAVARDGRVEFDLTLASTGSAMVSLGMRVPGVTPLPSGPKVAACQELAGPFAITLTEPNTLPLDYCQFRAAGENYSEPVPTLKADKLIRARFGLGTRLGGECQPWYLYARGAVDTAPRGPFQMRRVFHVTAMPKVCKLAIERPEDFTITLNGKAVAKPDGFWVDEDIRTIDITALLKAGENELLLDFNYRPDMELEDLYLVGDFGVSKLDASNPARYGNYTLTAPVRSLTLGSWVGQGLDFYGAAVRYAMQVQRPAQGRVRVRLPGLACTAAVVEVNGQTFPLPWAPMEADITDALQAGTNEIVVEVIGGRKNILGPLHTPWEPWTGPGNFNPDHGKWTDAYLLTDHGLTAPVVVETCV